MSWDYVTLDSVKAPARYALVGGPFGSNLTTRDYVDEGVPVIRGGNLPDHGMFLDDDFVFVSEEKADELIANTAHPGDVIFTQRGTLGQVGIIPETSSFRRYVISQSQMKLTVAPDRANSRFIYYFFRHPETVQNVRNLAITSGVPHINLGILKAMEVPLPPLGVQQDIVDVLSAYDDLIENNRRRMALLEESARLLHREWFVHLRFPGHERTPIVDGAPEGWTRTCLEELLVLQRGFDLPVQGRNPGGVPIYGSTGVVGWHDVAKVPGPGIVTGRSGTLGQVCYVAEDYWPLNTSLWVKEFKRVPPLFALFLLRELDLKQFNGGASVPTLDRKTVHRIEVLLPPTQILAEYSGLVSDNFMQIGNLSQQSQKLRTARDLLLPRLMSGEITP